MFDSILEGIYNRLKPIADKNRTYSKINTIAFVFFVIIYLALTSLFRNIAAFLNLDSMVFLVISVSTWAVLFLLIVRGLRKKTRKYNLTVDDWSIFFACSILKNLEQYSVASKNQNHLLEKEYRNMAVQDAEDFLSTIEKYWTIGNFKLAKKVLNDVIPKFKKNLQTRLIPNLERLDKGIFDKVEHIVYNIAVVMLNVDLTSLNHLNDSSFLQLNELPSSEVKLLSRWSNYLQSHKIQRHVLVITVIGVVGFSSYGIGRYLGASIDLSYGAAIGLFGILLAAYITIKRESPKTTESK